MRPQDVGQRGARDHAVLHDVVRADPPDRRERRLAALPDQRALDVVGRHPDLERAGVGAHPLDVGELGVDLTGRPVQLGDHHRAGTGRIARMDRRLRRLDRERVHQLDRRRQHAGRDDRADRGAGIVDGAEAGENGLHRLRRPHQPDRRLGDDAQRALAADDRADEVVPDRVRRPTTEPSRPTRPAAPPRGR